MRVTKKYMNTTLDRSGAARTARHLVTQWCCDARAGTQCCDTAVLLTSEIVTNALLHGCGAVRLGVQAIGLAVRVEVGDDEPRHPRTPAQDDDAEGGRGMLIVDALASAWGVIDNALGKIVWFEIACQP